MEQILDDYIFIEDASKELTLMFSGGSMSLQKKATAKLNMMLDWIVKTLKQCKDMEMALKEEEKQLAEKLVKAAEERERSLAECQNVEQELLKAKQQKDAVKFELQCLLKEWEELKEMEEEVERLQHEVDEDTTTTIPSAVYIAQLYHKVTKIRWNFDCDPTLLKGIHYGPDIAQPINIDSTQHSRSFICNHLWSLVSTEW